MARSTVYNSNETVEKWEKVNKKNKDLLDEFIEYLQSTDKSPTTINAYTSDAHICWIWNLEFNDNKFFVDFTKRDIMRYQNYLLNTQNLSSSRIRRLKATISSIGNFIEAMMDEEFPNYRSIVNKIPAPQKNPVRDKTILTSEQVKTILDYLVEKKQYQRACAFALASSSGSRKSEILRFKVSYFVEDNIIYNALYKTPEKMKTKGRGRNGKQIYRYTLVNTFKPYLDLWLEQRKELGVKCDELFVIKKNDKWIPMKVSTLDSWADIFSRILGVDFYFHSLRHYFTTSLSEQNIPADVIKDIVGWENLEMVSLYTDTEVDNELGKYFSEDGVKQVEKKGLNDL